MVREEYKEKLINLITQHFPNASIYLFGSRATGSHGSTSDIDIAVDVKEKADEYKMAQIRLSVDDLNIPLDIDIVDFHSIPQDFRKRIEKEKIIWKK